MISFPTLESQIENSLSSSKCLSNLLSKSLSLCFAITKSSTKLCLIGQSRLSVYFAQWETHIHFSLPGVFGLPFFRGLESDPPPPQTNYFIWHSRDASSYPLIIRCIPLLISMHVMPCHYLRKITDRSILTAKKVGRKKIYKRRCLVLKRKRQKITNAFNDYFH